MTKKNVFTALSGMEIPIKPISPTKLMKAEMGVEKAFKKRNEPIDVPTYKIETVGGGYESYDLDEDSITAPDDEKETAKRQADWDAHQDALKRLREAQFEVTKKIVLNSIDLKLPEDESWIEEQEELYIEVPKDKRERWNHWLETEILHPTDVTGLIAQILYLSASGILPEEEVKAAVSLFLDSVLEESEETGDSDPTSEDAEEDRTLETKPLHDGDSSSERVGDDPK